MSRDKFYRSVSAPSFHDQLGFSIKKAIFNLTATNILAMNGAPVAVLAAPLSTEILVVDDIVFEMNSTATQFAAGGAVQFQYHGTSTLVHAGSIPASVITAAAGTSYTLLGGASGANGTTIPAGIGVDITNATAAFTTGTGTARIFISYRLITVP